MKLKLENESKHLRYLILQEGKKIQKKEKVKGEKFGPSKLEPKGLVFFFPEREKKNWIFCEK